MALGNESGISANGFDKVDPETRHLLESELLDHK